MNDLIWEISRQGDYFSYQLSQVAGLKDIETVSRMDAGTITLYSEHGTDMDLLFIDVNEKMDRAINSMPKDMERPAN